MIKRYNPTIKIGVSTCVAVFVVVIALCRSFAFQTKLLVIIGCALTGIVILFRKSIYITIYDLFFITSLILVFIYKNASYPWTSCLYVLLAVLSLYAFRTTKDINAAMKFISFFSFANTVINLICILNSDIYFVIIKYILSSDAVESARYYFNHNGFISGLSDHYSRNAYFCVVGASVSAAILFSKTNKKAPHFIALLTQIVMIMVIGKRGHLLFFCVALAFVYLLTEPKISKKITRLIKLLMICGICFIFLIVTLPAVSFVFERFMVQQSTGDISTGRFDLWAKALNYFLQKPLFGWGYGFFNTHVYNESLQVYFAGVHNDYLQWLCEQGVVGFVLNIVPMIGLYIVSLKVFKQCVAKLGANNSIEQVLIIWSVLFQTFVILYSLTGLPHFDFEINIIYYISLNVPVLICSEKKCKVKLRMKKLIWRI